MTRAPPDGSDTSTDRHLRAREPVAVGRGAQSGTTVGGTGGGHSRFRMTLRTRSKLPLAPRQFEPDRPGTGTEKRWVEDYCFAREAQPVRSLPLRLVRSGSC